jgi:hypothetical protein
VIKFVSLLATGRWVSPGSPVSSTNKTDRHDIAEILLSVALNTITPYVFINLRHIRHLRLHISNALNANFESYQMSPLEFMK